MSEFISQYNGVEFFFLICAVVGGFFVVIRFIMLLIGFDHDLGSDMDVGGHDFDAHHADSDTSFHILSLHGITAFLMMFGLVGLALYRQSRLGILIAMIGAIVGGSISVWIIGKLFLFANKMKSSGTISIDSTVGAEGKVYLKIPDNGTGRVLVNVRNSLREYDATSHDNQNIDTGTPIRVVWLDGNVLVVERI